MSRVEYRGVAKSFGGVQALHGFDLVVPDGAFLVMLGPSGCGKTTALRILAGLELPDDGKVMLGDRDVTRLQPRDRDVAMVFQSYALYPHMTVRRNIEFPLRSRNVSSAERARLVADVAVGLGLTSLLDRKPAQLSGGQRQRVALARAIVRRPAAFLMDEPLSNLDAKLRVQTRAEIAKLQSDLGVTTLYVTHDQVEAMTMGNRVAVMRKGELQQVDEPQTLYDRPLNLFVGGFIGSPAMNMLDATIEQANGDLRATIGEQTISLGQETVSQRPGLRAYAGKQVIIGIRPEDLEDAALESDAPADRTLRGRLELREALGSEIMAHFAMKAAHAETDETRELAEDVGQPEGTPQIGVEENEAVVVGRFSPRSRLQAGDEVVAVVDTRALHFFDPATGAGIYDETPPRKGEPS